MTKLLKICIVGLTIFLVSCNTWELRYKVPKVENGVILSSGIFFVNPTTGSEYEVDYEDCIGFKVYSPDSQTALYTFANKVMLENVKLSKCVDRRCIRDIVKNSEFGVKR